MRWSKLVACEVKLTFRLTTREINPDPSLRVSPEKGNVSFASTQMGWCFTLKSFAKMYADTYGSSSLLAHLFARLMIRPGPMDLDQFADRLWGNIYFNPETRKFSKQSAPGSKRGFEHFVLEPLYKLYSQVCPSASIRAVKLGLT